MTLDDLERQNKGCYGFLAISRCETFQKRIAPKSIEIDIDKYKLQKKFLTLNVDFEGPSLDFPGSRKPAQESIKER